MSALAGLRRLQRLSVLGERHVGALLVAGYTVAAGLGSLWLVSLLIELAGPNTSAGHHDFFAFYAAGTLVREHHPELLYSAPALTGIERQIYPHPTGYAGYMPFLNPPAAAALLAPLSALPESVARWLWLGITVTVALVAAWLLAAGRDPRMRPIVLLATFFSFAAYQSLVEGQWSFLMLLGCLGALEATRRGHPWVAGVALAALWLKPPLLLLVLAWLLLTRAWRVAGGAVAAVVGVTVLALPWTGLGANVAYAQYLGGVTAAHAGGAGAVGATTWEGALPNMEGLLGLAATVAGQQHALAVDLITLVISLTLAGWFLVGLRGRWRERASAPVAIAAVCLGLVLDPHLYAQDCVLLLIPVALALGEARTLRARVWLGLSGVSRGRIEALILLAGLALMDLAAVDTLSVQDAVLAPPHLLTLALIAGVVLLGPRRTRAVAQRNLA